VSENIGPEHLVQWTKIAYGKEAEVPTFEGLALPEPATRPRLPEGKIDYSFDWVGGKPSRPGNTASADIDAAEMDEIRAEIRSLILEELRAIARERN
jgi:hypothetical protein